MAHLAGNILRKVVYAAALSALLAGAASAQLPNVNLLSDNPLTPEEEEKRKATEDAYKSAIKKIPDKEQKSVDPWENMRPNSSTASKTKQRQQ